MDRNSDWLSAACRRHGAGADQQRRLSQSPVRMIVPFGAGGPGDIFARLIGQKLSERLGQQFVIENRPGAGGNIGASVVARAPADGYTLLVGSSTLWVNASLYPQIPYDPVRDFEPIIIGATSPEVLVVVHPSVPAKTVQEKRANYISIEQLRGTRRARARWKVQ